MSPQQEIEEELERFIAFGGVLDKSTRVYFAYYLRKKLIPLSPEPPALNTNYARYFSQSLDALFGNDALIRLCRSNETMGAQILRDTLYWFRKTFQRIGKEHPYQDEAQELESWGVRHLRQFVRSHGYLIGKVSSYYTKEELDPSFHAKRFKELIRGREVDAISAEDRAEIERVYTDLLGSWDARLQAKILEYQLSRLHEEQESFKAMLDAKAEEFEKLTSILSPFTEYAGRYWDMSRQLWNETSFDVLKEYDALLQDEESLRKLADILGKMRAAEIETEEEIYEKVVVTGKYELQPHLRSEVTGVTESNNLSALLSSEIGLLSHPATEDLFLKKFADEQLMTHQYNDKELVDSEDIISESYQTVKKKEKGPFIVCVDTSGSMEGDPERIAKVLCFAILKMAGEDERSAYLINFSTGIKTIDLYNLSKSIDAVAKFLQMSFQGGTDISLALNEALEQLERNEYQDADVLIISDFIMYRISDDLTQRMRHQQVNAGTQFHSLVITDQANEEVIEAFDHCWLYNPDEKGVVKRLYNDVKGIAARQI
jgi:uncharacterized protein with von Willebrand factor type A (vWA) domain